MKKPVYDSVLVGAEREKYRRMWELPEYNRHSTGRDQALTVAAALRMKPGQTLLDYGCGPGYALEVFAGLKVQATGVDLVKLRPDVIESCLWNMGDEVPVADWAYCCDTMEHLPKNKVAAALAGIAKRTRRGGFFHIHTGNDSHGKLIGEKLHLTVRPAQWWQDHVSEHFTLGKVATGTNYVNLYVKKKSGD